MSEYRVIPQLEVLRGKLENLRASCCESQRLNLFDEILCILASLKEDATHGELHVIVYGPCPKLLNIGAVLGKLVVGCCERYKLKYYYECFELLNDIFSCHTSR